MSLDVPVVRDCLNASERREEFHFAEAAYSARTSPLPHRALVQQHALLAFQRRERLHYCWNSSDIVLPASLTAGLAGPMLLRVRFEPNTIRGWTAPAAAEATPKLRLVA